MKLIKRQQVGASISDAAANLSVLGLFQIVQDAVTEMMGKLKIDGVTVRKKYNGAWVFVRNRIKLYKRIPWSCEEELSVTSFISSKTRATFCADTSICDEHDEPCAYSRLEICGLDVPTMRIRRVESMGVTDEIMPEQSETDISFTKFDSAAERVVDRVQVRSTNIDMSQHTNNVEYIRLILNTYSVKELARPMREIEIRYVDQSYENDILEIYKESSTDKDIFLLKCRNKDIVKCEILF